MSRSRPIRIHIAGCRHTPYPLACPTRTTHLDAVVDAKVELQVKNLCESDVIKATRAAYANNEEEKKPVLVYGWVYDVATGRIRDLDITRGPSV